MITIFIKATGERREVTRNIAHDLIDRGIAELVRSGNTYPAQPLSYPNRQMRASRDGRGFIRTK